eukprot:TRINITY_DN8320_c0_g1_i2.p1 TRINITY_DN8320_c0_g1~~TRINITY_DN8320_c0_g1_i2.p1  ORF type:complete len:467 (+),score=88.07 TRINITY_DN8320_c0_g1_i2:42-1403(+)
MGTIQLSSSRYGKSASADEAGSYEQCAASADVSVAMRISDAVDLIGAGKFQRTVGILCGLGVCADGMEKSSLMYIIQGASGEWKVEGELLGLLGSSAGLGQAIGSFAFGLLSDLRGRRHALLSALLCTFVLGVLGAAMPDYRSFLLLRFLVNIGLGGALPCAFTLFTEFLPTKLRSSWTPALYSSYGVGRLLTSVVAWATLHVSWRVYVLTIAFPSVVLLVCQRKLPETPQSLLARQRPDEARLVLEAAAAANGVPSPLVGQDGERLELVADEVADGDSANAPAQSLAAALCRRSGMLLCLSWFLLAIGTEWFSWVLKILLMSGVPEDIALRGLILFNTNELIVPMFVAVLPVSRSGGGRRLALTCALAALVLAAFARALDAREGLFFFSRFARKCPLHVGRVQCCGIALQLVVPLHCCLFLRDGGVGSALYFDAHLLLSARARYWLRRLHGV